MWDATQSHGAKPLVIISIQNAKGGLAEPSGPFQHCVENRHEIAWRGIDDLEDLGGRGLLVQCFSGLGDQPRVLHRDDRLCREVL